MGGTVMSAGARVELARYSISTGERVVWGQRIDGVVRLSDVAADGHGRRYLIERGIACRAELDAIVADYVEQAAEWDWIPALPHCLGRPEGTR
jgi:hypothetical protein